MRVTHIPLQWAVNFILIASGIGALIGGAVEKKYLQKTDTTPWRYKEINGDGGYLLAHYFHDKFDDSRMVFIRGSDGLYDLARKIDVDNLTLKTETGVKYDFSGENIIRCPEIKRETIIAGKSETRPSIDKQDVNK
jgi:hypothetical protein